MRINLAIFVPITVLSVSLSLITLTFILADWLMDVASLDTYGIWQACFVESNYCLPWLEMSNTFNITTPGYFTAFQVLQSSMLGLTFISIALILLSIKFLPHTCAAFILDAFVVAVSTGCGVASLVIFAVKIYNPNVHRLRWCFWASVAVCVLEFLSSLFLFSFAIRISEHFFSVSHPTQRSTPRHRKDQQQQQQYHESQSKQVIIVVDGVHSDPVLLTQSSRDTIARNKITDQFKQDLANKIEFRNHSDHTDARFEL